MTAWDQAVAYVTGDMLSDPDNEDVYQPRLGDLNYRKVPHCIYFYYVEINNEGKIRVDHYFHVRKSESDESIEIPYADVPNLMKRLAEGAISGNLPENTQLLPSHSFNSIPWKYWSYIAIFINEPNWKLLDRAIVFDREPTRNHSFFDARNLPNMQIENNDGGTDRRSGVYFVNHMKGNRFGDDSPENPPQRFKFNIWLEAKYARENETGMRVNFDPGGTNQGPPDHP